MQDLYTQLDKTHPFYIRCLKPNTKQSPRLFEEDLVHAQLKYLGVTETIRIRKLGYPFRCGNQTNSELDSFDTLWLFVILY